MPKADALYNHIKPLPPAPRKSTIEFTEPSRTRQEFADECDINKIMERYQRTGIVSHINKYEPTYGDCPAVDFQGALEIVRQGDEMFNELPSKVRAHFKNDPAAFLSFVENEENREEAIMLGLIEEPSAPPSPAEPPPPSPPSGGDD